MQNNSQNVKKKKNNENKPSTQMKSMKLKSIKLYFTLLELRLRFSRDMRAKPRDFDTFYGSGMAEPSPLLLLLLAVCGGKKCVIIIHASAQRTQPEWESRSWLLVIAVLALILCFLCFTSTRCCSPCTTTMTVELRDYSAQSQSSTVHYASALKWRDRSRASQR